MSNLWELITNASTLPIQPGNTLWDHLNNLGAGGPITLQIFEDIEVELDMCEYDIELESDYEVELEANEFDVELDPEEFDVEVCQ